MSQVRGHNSRDARARKRRHKASRSVFFICLSVICFTIAVGALQLSLRRQESAYRRQEKSLQVQISNEKARAKELNELEAYMKSDRYIGDTAREKLGMAYPNDLLLKAR